MCAHSLCRRDVLAQCEDVLAQRVYVLAHYVLAHYVFSCEPSFRCFVVDVCVDYVGVSVYEMFFDCIFCVFCVLIVV